MAIMKMWKNKNLIFKILSNYFILLFCVVGFRGGAVLTLVLPVLQICLSWFNYSNSEKWQTVLRLEAHLLISTVLGIYLEGYLYLKYVYNDAEGVLVFLAILKIGAVFVFTLGVITALLKYLLTKKSIQEKNM